MAYRIQLSEEAEADIDHAIEWYETKQKDLGMRFAKTLDVAFGLLSAFPLSFSEVYSKRLRKSVLNHFPYTIYYKVFEDSQLVRVVAVLHAKQDNARLRRRL